MSKLTSARRKGKTCLPGGGRERVLLRGLVPEIENNEQLAKTLLGSLEYVYQNSRLCKQIKVSLGEN